MIYSLLIFLLVMCFFLMITCSFILGIYWYKFKKTENIELQIEYFKKTKDSAKAIGRLIGVICWLLILLAAYKITIFVTG